MSEFTTFQRLAATYDWSGCRRSLLQASPSTDGSHGDGGPNQKCRSRGCRTIVLAQVREPDLSACAMAATAVFLAPIGFQVLSVLLLSTSLFVFVFRLALQIILALRQLFIRTALGFSNWGFVERSVPHSLRGGSPRTHPPDDWRGTASPRTQPARQPRTTWWGPGGYKPPSTVKTNSLRDPALFLRAQALTLHAHSVSAIHGMNNNQVSRTRRRDNQPYRRQTSWTFFVSQPQ